jgi:ATP-dependent exoDNAse (exonuclease V) beta subunit
VESADAPERKRVLDPTQSFLVQAPAGSGKTELLIQRYLTLLAHESVQQPEAVLAITFTKKAAAEMRNRVLEALRNSGCEAPEDPHKRITWDLAKKVASREQALGWRILDTPERLEIRTVDSFCEKIANRTPLLARLGQLPNIAADFTPLYAEAAERTLLLLGDGNETTRAAIAQVLRDQDNRMERLQQFLVQLLEKREQWLRILGRSDLHSSEEQARLRSTLENALCDAIESELRKVKATIERLLTTSKIEEILTYGRYAGRNLPDDDCMAKLRGVRALPPATMGHVATWKAVRHLCLTKEGEIRARLDKNCGFPDPSGEKNNYTALLKTIKDADFCDDLCEALLRIDCLPPATYDEGQWASLLALFRVLPRAVANLRMVFAEHGEADHSEVSMAASMALGDREHPSDLALHLGYKIQHLLVDEFQDTSLTQTELLEKLIRAWEPGAGATLFVVGDPMQSIYMFREAEVALFLRAAENGFGEGAWPLEVARLSSNFRSRPELVHWFNRTFPQILAGNDEVTGAVAYEAADAERSSDAHARVTLHSAPHKDYLAEAARVAAIVREELNADAKSVAVLVRSRTHVAHIAPALRDAGIPFRAKDIDVLAERQTVLDLHALTKALLHLADRTAWLALLRGPWCGLSLADLWTLCRGDKARTIWELLRDRAKDLSPRGQAVLARILPALEAAMQQRGRVPLRALVESLWISIGGPAALTGAEHDAKVRDADAYLALLQKLESHGEIDEVRLGSEIEKLYAPADTSDGIRVELMTIHGAKGLQFDVVIVPGLNRVTQKNQKQLLNWRERIVGDHRDLLLAPMEPVDRHKKGPTTIAKYIVRLGDECAAEEAKRLLYVAATRAKERLHFVSTMPDHDKPPKSGSMLALLPGNVLAEFPAVEFPETPPGCESKSKVFRRLPENWTMPATPPALRFEPRYARTADLEVRKHTFVRVGEDLRRIGTVTHRVLQQIGDDGIESWSMERIAKLAPAIRAMLVQQGIRSPDLAGAERRVRKALENTLSDRNGRWILQRRDHANNEYGLAALLDERRFTIKVDRTFIEGDTRWLIDYKTSDKESTITQSYLDEQIAKYRGDLTRYAKVLQAFDGRSVKGGLYFPLLLRWCPVDLPD